MAAPFVVLQSTYSFGTLSQAFDSRFVSRETKTPQVIHLAGFLKILAERVGFEPTVRHNRTPDFESGAFDHSATFPTF
jgi:hypothetical protein